jgi:uncharacterized protein YcfL
MKKILALSLCLFLIVSCQEKSKETVLQNGTYRGVLSVQDQQELPFIFKVTSPQSMELYNSNEVLEVSEISYRNDTVFIQMPVFESYIWAVFEGD